MSELINNLQEIYDIKLQLKEALGTSSDDFSQYPAYVSSLSPSGTSYITTNGNYNIASYAYVDVDVPQSTGSNYSIIDLSSSPSLVVGNKYEMTCEGSGNENEFYVTAEMAEDAPWLTPFIGTYILENDFYKNGNNYAFLSLSYTSGQSFEESTPAVFRGTYLTSAEGYPVFMTDSFTQSYCGGNGGLEITDNVEGQWVGQYSYVNVNVPQGGGTSYTLIPINASSLTVGGDYEIAATVSYEGVIDSGTALDWGISSKYVGYYYYYFSQYDISDRDEFIADIALSENYLTFATGYNNLFRCKFVQYLSFAGANLFEITSVGGPLFIGGELSYTITENRTGNEYYDVSSYSTIQVNVPQGGGSSYEFVENALYECHYDSGSNKYYTAIYDAADPGLGAYLVSSMDDMKMGTYLSNVTLIPIFPDDYPGTDQIYQISSYTYTGEVEREDYGYQYSGTAASASDVVNFDFNNIYKSRLRRCTIDGSYFAWNYNGVSWSKNSGKTFQFDGLIDYPEAGRFGCIDGFEVV